MDYLKWPPGPLLRPTSAQVPPAQDIVFEAPCHCVSVADPLMGHLDAINRVYVTQSAILLAENSLVVLEKRLALLDLTAVICKHIREISFVTLPRRANVLDDFEMDLVFDTRPDCEDFRRAVKNSNVTAELQTNIYLLSEICSPKASPGTLITPCEITDLVTSVLTSLTYSDCAEIFAPLVDWSVEPRNPQNRLRAISRVQQSLRSQPPPLVLILPPSASHQLPSLIDWRDDPASAGSFPAVRHLPSLPTWNGTGDAPSKWMSLPIGNYGVHIRQDNCSHEIPTTSRRYIAISFEVVDWFMAAVSAASSQQGPDQEHAAASLAAATASLKMTVVHELGHMFVSDEGIDSPPRSKVSGADIPRFDVAESSQHEGRIEAGLLVETVWMGGVHELGVGNDGWLSLVLNKGDDTASTNTYDSPSTNAAECGTTFLLGSPIQLVNQRPEEDDEFCPEDSPYSMFICQPELVSKFSSSALPTFTNEQIQSQSVYLEPGTPVQRQKTRVVRSAPNSPARLPTVTVSPAPNPHTTSGTIPLPATEKVVVVREHLGPKCTVTHIKHPDPAS
ncbi:hypothetical protein FB45DRAFT_209902 [Roridomyces roridus]|uniref:Uncharacterized protein n=1 Tax=Roridomyces roridus TaxID=1738132 RepID=A0AAD7CGI7_9AGAR|nr:hypothetical protein FB45DRAFT_209902 [Roridomyces roridus]